MGIHLKITDLVLVFVTSLIVILISIIGWNRRGLIVIFFSLGLVLFIILVLLFEGFRRNEMDNKRLNQNYRQIEALLSLLSVINPRRPLPPMRRWVISPDFANIIISMVIDHKPKVICECGGGISTVFTCYCLDDLKDGHVFSLEQDGKYAQKTKKNLKAHGLENYATVIYAPLTNLTLKAKSWKWYNTSFKKELEKIDMLVIDGPSGDVQKMARYPALPVLYDTLSENAVIIVDDAKRKDERDMVKAWLTEFKDLEYEWYDTEKGCVILRRRSHKKGN
ncbi:MAG: class I SAM-dependent methyltransferase [Thermoplasmata archaeon]|nr:MAG: class I SAM-dependent methyltransferase [Thermoplasmata archaeon]